MIEQERQHPYLLISVFSERAGDHLLFTSLQDGKKSFEDFDDRHAKPDTVSHALSPYYRYMVLRGHAQVLQLMTEAVALARLPVEEREPLVRQWEATVKNARSENPMVVMLPAVTKVADSELRLHAELRCMNMALAMERYRIKNGHWPERLEDLKPDCIADVPIDPYDCQPIHCRRLEDGFVIYCVGPDHEDNGGTLDRKRSIRAGADIGFRLFDVEQRRLPAERKEEEKANAPP
jgi:hypothetical protein